MCFSQVERNEPFIIYFQENKIARRPSTLSQILYTSWWPAVAELKSACTCHSNDAHPANALSLHNKAEARNIAAARLLLFTMTWLKSVVS